ADQHDPIRPDGQQFVDRGQAGGPQPLHLGNRPAGAAGQQQRRLRTADGADDHANPRTTRRGGSLPRMVATMSSTCRVSGTLCARNTVAPCQAHTAVADSVPSTRCSSGRSSASPTKSLFDNETSTGQPVATSSDSRRVSSSECQVFLPKSCPGSISTRSAGTPSSTARSASPTVRASTSANTSS